MKNRRLLARTRLFEKRGKEIDETQAAATTTTTHVYVCVCVCCMYMYPRCSATTITGESCLRGRRGWATRAALRLTRQCHTGGCYQSDTEKTTAHAHTHRTRARAHLVRAAHFRASYLIRRLLSVSSTTRRC